MNPPSRDPIKGSRYFLTWLAFWGCYVGLRLLFGAYSAFVVTMVSKAANLRPDTVERICQAIAALLSVVISYIVFRLIVGRLIVMKVQETLQAAQQQAAGPAPQGAAPSARPGLHPLTREAP